MDMKEMDFEIGYSAGTRAARVLFRRLQALHIIVITACVSEADLQEQAEEWYNAASKSIATVKKLFTEGFVCGFKDYIDGLI